MRFYSLRTEQSCKYEKDEETKLPGGTAGGGGGGGERRAVRAENSAHLERQVTRERKVRRNYGREDRVGYGREATNPLSLFLLLSLSLLFVHTRGPRPLDPSLRVPLYLIVPFRSSRSRRFPSVSFRRGSLSPSRSEQRLEP